MKNILAYNYNLKNPNIYKVNNKIYVKDNSGIYLLEKVTKKKIEYEISSIDKSFNEIMHTKNNNIFVKYKNNIYILERINPQVINDKEIIKDYKNRKIIKQNRWKELWINKVDKIEKLKIVDKNLIELNSYFLGMAETAICFLNNNKEEIEEKQNSICRIRINDKEYRNNNNIILDYKERDYAEYSKYLFFSKKEKKAINFIKQIDYKKYSKILIYSRLLFPTYYFDIIENKVLNNKISEKQINLIKNNIERYESFLVKISIILFDKLAIKWLNKK